MEYTLLNPNKHINKVRSNFSIWVRFINAFVHKKSEDTFGTILSILKNKR